MTLTSDAHEELKNHLIRNGFTLNAEGELIGTPCKTREIQIDVFVNEILTYLIASGYVSYHKLTQE